MPAEQLLNRHISEMVRSEIASGIFTGALPSMDRLAVRYGVSRLTVRAGLKRLEDEGLVIIRQGKGTFVNTDSEDCNVDAGHRFPGSFLEAIGRYSSFLTDPAIPSEIKLRMIGLVDLQIGMVKVMLPQTSAAKTEPEYR